MNAFGRAATLAVLGLVLGGSASAQTPDPGPLDEPELVLPDSTYAPQKADLADPKAVEPALRRAFESPHGFCKDPDYELGPDERRLCLVAEAARERCPGFARACERTQSGHAATEANKSAKGHDRSRARGNGRRGAGRESDDARWEVSSGPLGALIGGVIQVVFWALLVFGIGAMLYAGINAFLGRRREPKLDHPQSSDATVAPIPRAFPTGSPEELLARARDVAVAGEIKSAMSLVLRALLRHLEIGGRLELHPSRTNGDYARSLRRQGFDPRELRRVAAEVEAVEFGGGRASPEAFSALHAHVSKLVHAAGVVLAVLSFGVLTGCEERPAEDSVNSCGTNASGYSALCEALAARGVKVRRRFAKIEAIADEVSRIVVLDDDVEPGELRVLRDWVERKGGVLVVLGGASSFAGAVPSAVPCSDNLVLEAGAWSVPANVATKFLLPRASVFEHSGLGRVHVRCGERPFAVQTYEGTGSIIAIADWRFATNASLAVADNAALAASLVAPPGATVELIGYWTGTGSELPAESL